MMTQSDPAFFPIIKDRATIAELLSIDVADLLTLPLQGISTGTPKLLVPVRSLKILFAIKPKLKAISDYCKQTGLKGFYPFTTETIEKTSDFHARQFNPLAGINEDPITGIAAGALGVYAKKYFGTKKSTFVIEQGVIMNKAGIIFVDVTNAVKVGGYSVIYSSI